MTDEELNAEHSGKAVNRCIVGLSVGKNDVNDVVGRWGDVSIITTTSAQWLNCKKSEGIFPPFPSFSFILFPFLPSLPMPRSRTLKTSYRCLSERCKLPQ